MIPKKMHYCWFGDNQLPDITKTYIKSWQDQCPDYEIIEWNETNFDIHMNEYIQQAYMSKKYAFVTDYVRLWVLYNYGGIYMDTDVEVVQNLDFLLVHPAFLGFESNDMLQSGIIGAEKNNNWIKLLLDEYEGIQFLDSNGIMDLTTNVVRITETTKRNYPIVFDNQYQAYGDFVIYPSVILCAKNCETGNYYNNNRTVAIHHFSGSWHTTSQKRYRRLRQALLNKYHKTNSKLCLHLLNGIEGIVSLYKKCFKYRRRTLR